MILLSVLAIVALVLIVLNLPERPRSSLPKDPTELALLYTRAIEQAIITHCERHLHAYPESLDLNDLVTCNHIGAECLIDPWGTPFRAVMRGRPGLDDDRVDVISAGPDRLFDTPDDLMSGYE
jgi:hypothetical protein